jgi:hypothetical protein
MFRKGKEKGRGIGYWNWLPILVANLPLEFARARIGYWNNSGSQFATGIG